MEISTIVFIIDVYILNPLGLKKKAIVRLFMISSLAINIKGFLLKLLSHYCTRHTIIPFFELKNKLKKKGKENHGCGS